MLQLLRVGSDGAAERCASAIAARLRLALGERGHASLAVSGGSTPGPMLAALSLVDLDWEHVSIHQVDERMVPNGDERRNAARLTEIFGDHRAHLVTLDVAAVMADPQAIGAVEARLPDRFDVVQLGLGGDGHTASLLPGDPTPLGPGLLAISGELDDMRRITLTRAAIRAARHRVWLVMGASKADVVPRLVRADPQLVATSVLGHGDVLVTDQLTS